jgi:hypothetical protein
MEEFPRRRVNRYDPTIPNQDPGRIISPPRRAGRPNRGHAQFSVDTERACHAWRTRSPAEHRGPARAFGPVSRKQVKRDRASGENRPSVNDLRRSRECFT